LPVSGLAPSLARAGEERLLHQAIVLHEAHEDAGQEPGDGGLGEHTLAPDLEGLAGAPSIPGRSVLALQSDIHFRDSARSLTQVAFEDPQQPFQIIKQTLGVDQGSSLPIAGSLHGGTYAGLPVSFG
jgi:hypothetical protein